MYESDEDFPELLGRECTSQHSSVNCWIGVCVKMSLQNVSHTRIMSIPSRNRMSERILALQLLLLLKTTRAVHCFLSQVYRIITPRTFVCV